MIGWTNVQSHGSGTALIRIMYFMHSQHQTKKTMTIRSKHNDLMNYFVHDERDLSRAYVQKCKKFIWGLRDAGLVTKKAANTLFHLRTSKNKQAPQLNDINKHRKTCTKNKQAK